MSEGATYDFVRYHSEDGTFHAIRKKGRKFHHLVIIDHPISILKVAIKTTTKEYGEVEEEKYMTIMPDDLATGVRKFRAAAKRREITEGAKQILDEAEAWNTQTG